MTGTTRLSLFGVTLVAAAVCTSLGLWQGRRLMARRAANAEAIAGRNLPLVNLNRDGPEAAGPERRVRATGVYDHARTMVLWGRDDRGAPGVHLAVPLLLDGQPLAIMVNRGFAPALDAIRPDTDWDRAEQVTVEGIALSVPVTQDSGGPLVRGGTTVWRRLDRGALRARLPYPVADLMLHQTVPDTRAPGTRPFPRPAALPQLDDGPHLSYMVQWFGLAAAAVAFGVIFVLRGGTREK